MRHGISIIREFARYPQSLRWSEGPVGVVRVEPGSRMKDYFSEWFRMLFGLKLLFCVCSSSLRFLLDNYKMSVKCLGFFLESLNYHHLIQIPLLFRSVPAAFLRWIWRITPIVAGGTPTACDSDGDFVCLHIRWHVEASSKWTFSIKPGSMQENNTRTHSHTLSA